MAQKNKAAKPKFIDRSTSTLPPEAFTDPDYALKQLQKYAEELNPGIIFDASLCSRCHHCR